MTVENLSDNRPVSPVASSSGADRLLTHRFGANYVPSRSWWYCWNDFQADAVARDFDAIASLGLDHIRAMLIWPSFQPNPSSVSPAHKDRLGRLMELARERGLDVCVTAVNGFLSGYRFVPPFYTGESIYTHAGLLSAQEVYFARLAEVVNDFDNFIGFDLGNEINCYQTAALADGDAWMRRILSHARQVSPGRTHVNGVDHKPWFMPDTFSPAALVAEQDIVALHCWQFFTGALDLGGPLDRPSVDLLAGMAALARAYGSAPKKPIWVQEYGASLDWMSESDQTAYTERTTLRAIEGGVSWFTWWCSHDIDQSYDFSSLEYGLGLMTVDNIVKPNSKVFSEIAKAYGGHGVAIEDIALPPPPLAPSAESTWQWLLQLPEA